MPKVINPKKPEYKVCTVCKRNLPFTAEWFNRSASRFYGLHEQCKACRKEYSTGEAATTARNKLSQTRLRAGKCRICGHPRMEHSASYCERHWLEGVSCHNLGTVIHWETLRNIAKQQEYKCAYSGKRLVPGLNMSLDHKQPIAGYPELANDVNNVQWVTWDVNRAKGTLSHDEFISLCTAVASQALEKITS